MNHDCTKLDWKPVLLVKVTRLPFGDTHTGLSVKRLYLAQHPDGILRADWTLPADERFLPLVQLIGWKPERDVPFDLPVQYQRGSSSHGAAVIPTGTWVLRSAAENNRSVDRRMKTQVSNTRRQAHHIFLSRQALLLATDEVFLPYTPFSPMLELVQ